MLLAVLIPVAAATVFGLFQLWPEPGYVAPPAPNPYATAQGVSLVTGVVGHVEVRECAKPGEREIGISRHCTVADTVPDAGGPAVPVEVTPEVAKAHGVHAGDKIRYLDMSGVAGPGNTTYLFMDFVRTAPMALLAVLYAVVVVAVARWRGLRAILGLLVASVVLAQFMLPALVAGRPAVLVALTGATAIMFCVLYFAHGFSARTSTALVGTLFGLGVTTLLAAWGTGAAHLTGLGDENTFSLVYLFDNVSLSGIVLCGLIIAGLGVLNDVTITQASAVWELYELAPATSARKLFAAAMRIGRDHIASTVYTIAFAAAGAALPVLILVSLNGRPLLDTLTGVELAGEVVGTLVGSIGLVLAIPLTTAVAVAVVKSGGRRRTMPARSGGSRGSIDDNALEASQSL